MKKFFKLLQASPADLRLSDEPGEFIPTQSYGTLAVDKAFLGQLLECQFRPITYHPIMKIPGTFKKHHPKEQLHTAAAYLP